MPDEHRPHTASDTSPDDVTALDEPWEQMGALLAPIDVLLADLGIVPEENQTPADAIRAAMERARLG